MKLEDSKLTKTRLRKIISVFIINDLILSVCRVRGEETSKAYHFDQVFDMNTRQSEVYKGLHIQQMIHKVVESYLATIYPYGQTGSVKTFTMEGNKYIKAQEQADGNRVTKGPVINKDPDEEQLGITYRSFSDLFRVIKRVKEVDGKHINVFCSFLQIYNERVQDLLNETSLQNTTQKCARISLIRSQNQMDKKRAIFS